MTAQALRGRLEFLAAPHRVLYNAAPIQVCVHAKILQCKSSLQCVPDSRYLIVAELGARSFAQSRAMAAIPEPQREE